MSNRGATMTSTNGAAGPAASRQVRPHVLVVHRWRENYAHYGRYLDHDRHAVSYITTDVGRDSIPVNAADVIVVEHTDDMGQVGPAAERAASHHGPPVAVLALKEDDLLTGAALREAWGCPGPLHRDLLAFRDKLVMGQAIQKAGLSIPSFAPVSGPEDVAAFAAAQGWPVIVKPRFGSASEGVVLVHGPSDFQSIWGLEPYLVQEYRNEPIYHVDGVFSGYDLPIWRASRYVNDCLGFRTGSFLGSVEEDAPGVVDAIGAEALRFMTALSAMPTVFHLEVFLGEGDGRPTVSFLEAGARVGGAEISLLWREIHGYDLMEAASRLQLGWPVPLPPPPQPPRHDGTGVVGGWLLVPAPATRPCRITRATSMVGRPEGPYAEALLQPGDVLPAADAYYEHVGGRFRFRGPTSAQVERAIRHTAQEYRVDGEPITDGGVDQRQLLAR